MEWAGFVTGTINWYKLLRALEATVYLLITFAFFVGILLIVSQEAFNAFDSDLQKEYGIKKRIFPNIENKQYHFIDFIILKNRFVAGIAIIIIAFILIVLYK